MWIQQLWLWGSRALGQCWCMGLLASQNVESSQTWDRTCVPSIGRQILIPYAMREVLVTYSFIFFEKNLVFIRVQLINSVVLYSKVIQLYIYMYLFIFKFFSHLDYYKILSRVLYSRFLLVILFKYSNVYVSTPSSHTLKKHILKSV